MALAPTFASAHRSLSTAQHEAAHVVVGVALGLRLRSAVVGYHEDPELGPVAGVASFDRRSGTTEAYALMLAAGVYFEERTTGSWTDARGDVRILRTMGHRPDARISVMAVAAGAILESRRAAWDAVTRALLERDITGADVAAIARGEPAHAIAAE